MEYISVKEAAQKWGISSRRVASLCTQERIEGATRVGNMWIIPATVGKPEDARHTRYDERTNDATKPFLKWAGGKSQLLGEIRSRYPFDGKITKYAEPFVGGGAVLFDILAQHDLAGIYISDRNRALINAYKAVRDDNKQLISLLGEYQRQYVPLDTEKRKEYYLKKREAFNERILLLNDAVDIQVAALLIFLNKTCFNGLYRVNRKGFFNVPMGSYKNPLICDMDKLTLLSQQLADVEIVCGDYKEATTFIDKNTFVYFDPPYRPLTETAAFTAYTTGAFDDEEQRRLATFCKECHEKGAKFLLSNADPRNVDVNDNFFDDLYKGFHIERVEAVRMINSKGNGRGKITELLISNY